MLARQVKFLGYYLKAAVSSTSRTRSKDLGQSKDPQKTSACSAGFIGGVRTLPLGRRARRRACLPPSRVRLLIPLNDLRLKLIEKGFADANGRPKYVGKFLFLSDYDIVKEYNLILTKILTFYSRYWKANKYSPTDSQRVGAYTLAPLTTLPPKGGSFLREGGMKGKGLGKIIYILEFSLAHTLSAKHRTSLPKIFKKYGRPFVVSRTESDSIVFAKPERLKS